MLTHTFRFLPGIGPATEEKLWAQGILTWQDYRSVPVLPRVPEKRKSEHDRILVHAERALEKGDGGFFARNLPGGDTWRCLRTFGDRAVYLDIETDPDEGVTVVGMHGPHKGSVALVQDKDLTPQAVHDYIHDASLLVTFNGASFDLPMMRRFGYHVPGVPHVDLRIVLRHLNLTGGLKKIERAVGLARDDDLDGVDGWEAVRLWRRHRASDHRDGDPLDKLVRYNLADVENLVPLATLAYDRLSERQRTRFPRQERLPVATL